MTWHCFWAVKERKCESSLSFFLPLLLLSEGAPPFPNLQCWQFINGHAMTCIFINSTSLVSLSLFLCICVFVKCTEGKSRRRYSNGYKTNHLLGYGILFPNATQHTRRENKKIWKQIAALHLRPASREQIIIQAGWYFIILSLHRK